MPPAQPTANAVFAVCPHAAVGALPSAVSRGGGVQDLRMTTLVGPLPPFPPPAPVLTLLRPDAFAPLPAYGPRRPPTCHHAGQRPHDSLPPAPHDPAPHAPRRGA